MDRDEHATTNPPKPASVREGTGQGVVLLVDDDATLARAIGRVLGAAGYSVRVVTSGPAAVETVMSETIDVIVSDIQMPGMSGVDLLSMVRAYDLDVPMILMTGNPTIDTAIEAVSLGAIQYLVKPVPNDVLVKAVNRASKLHQLAAMKREALQLQGGTGLQAGDRAGLQATFDRALETLWVAFQPIVDAGQNNKIYGYEALMRTHEPGLPTPEAMLGAAERLDCLPALGRRVRDLAAEGFRRAPEDALLFVNLHTRDLLDPELYEADSALMQMAHRVVLEITERTPIDDVKDVQARVAVLRFHGFRIAIDDLGAGYAGLSSFVALEPDIVKIDMSLVRGIHESVVKQRLVGSILKVCDELGIRVVVEGVEEIEECAMMRGMGCEYMQGFFFAKPARPFPDIRDY